MGQNTITGDEGDYGPFCGKEREYYIHDILTELLSSVLLGGFFSIAIMAYCYHVQSC